MNKPLILIACVTILGAGVLAQTTKRSRIAYTPKDVGQTKERTDGATRGGVESPPPVVRVLTPIELARVASDKPKLYWSINQPTTYKCDVVVKDMKDTPIFTKSFDGVKAPGLVAIDMSESDAKLQAGMKYRYMVLVDVKPKDGAADDMQDHASDIESAGTIRFDPPAADLQKQLDAAQGIDKAALLAENGYFTDAVAALKADGSAEANDLLKDLLSQVKLELK